MSEDKIVEKIGKLLLKVEGTDNEHEKEAFFSQAQLLGSKYEIDLEIARQKAASEGKQTDSAVIMKRFEMGQSGDRGAGAYTNLFWGIAEVNNLKVIMSNSEVEAFGVKGDIDITEALYTVIVIQMVKACSDYISSDEWRGNGIRVTDARKSFYAGYITRIKQRLWEAKYEAMREIDREQNVSSALVLQNKDREVSALYRDHGGFRLKTRGRLNAVSRRSSNAGQRAANQARLRRQDKVGGKASLPS